MYALTLCDQSIPPRTLDRRPIGDAIMRIGRDTSSDWVIEDPERTISRHHLELRASQDGLFLRPIGKNDIYLGDSPICIPRGCSTKAQAGDIIVLGPYRLYIEDAAAEGVIAHDAPASAPSVKPGHSLLDAFCEGAELDPSVLIAEDPTAIFREVGAVYRQAVLGLSQLLRQRSAIRADILADRTIVGSRDNNLIKWAPAHRLMVDLIANKQDGFLAGGNAVKSSFNDLETHIESLVAGHRSALQAVLDAIRPAMLESRAPRGILRDSAADSWTVFKQAYADLERDFDGDTEGTLRDGFARGYERSTSNRQGKG